MLRIGCAALLGDAAGSTSLLQDEMLDAGCAALEGAQVVCTALPEDAAGCPALLEVEGRCTEAPKLLYLRVH